MWVELSSLCFINSYDLHCTFPVHDLPWYQVIWAVFTTGLLMTHLLLYQHWAFHSSKFVANIPLSSSAVKTRFTDHAHCLPLTSHLLMSFHSIYLSLFTDCVSLVPSPTIPSGFTQLIIGRSCCRGNNSLKISLRIYWWDHTHVEHCLPNDGDSSLQWGRQALTLW